MTEDLSMTGDPGVTGAGGPAGHGPAVADLVARLIESTHGLAAATGQGRNRLLLRMGDVAVEVEWPSGAPAPGPQAVAAPADPAATPPPTAPPAVSSTPEAPGATDAAASPPVPVNEPGDHLVVSEGVGVFYRAAQPGAPAFVSTGDRVTAGQQLALLEAMKLMTPVTADRAGTVRAVLVADGDTVEHGTPLFALETA